ncbi:DUF4859 domain-containing protein [uncultured Draconibacterium sp.]|uniref:DUF4859 domain-containing protein n=1 Tax=uncultured Draconibacterium sp. TaxID=1573823 RepID=UPI0032173118
MRSMINTNYRKHYDLGIGKLSVRLLMVLVFAFTFITGCEGDEVTPDPDPEPDPIPVDTIPTDTTPSVVVLAESDVADFAKFYKPEEHKNVDFLRGDSKWTFVRSQQSDHFIVFWEEGFGSNPNASTVPASYRVDINDLLTKAEQFYDLNINQLKFAETGVGKSNLDNYKMQIYLFYTQEWMAYGAGYDDVIGALWINPGTVHPVGSVIAHEIGHSFQYQVFCDLGDGAGFRYGFGGNGGNGFWEQTAQWQAMQSYPEQLFEGYHYPVYCDNYHRHVIHEHMRYASYFIHYYWTEKHGIDMVGKVWREAKEPEDPFQAYMRINSLSVADFNDEMYEAASRFVTWDYDALRSYGSNYMGKQTYKLYQVEDGYYQVAYSRCPGTTGYNVIPLNVPEAGTVVSTSFKALTPGSALAANDPGEYTDNENTLTTRNYNSSSLTRAGWRYGYVALLNNGERVYGDMNKTMAGDIEFTIPEACSKLWLVVLGAPTTYAPHAWDEKEINDDQWPYKVKFSNTNLLGSVVINPDETPEDLTLTYDVSFAADVENYSGTVVSLNDNGDIGKVAQALVMQPSEIAGALLAAKQTPQEGKIAFAAVEPDGSLNYNTTANGLGFWYDGQGAVIGWGSDNDSKLFAEFTADNFQFSIGQYPGKSSAGDKYTVKEAFVYTKEGTQYQLTFVFNVTIQ